jgi:predicted SAM-dependent methyltransferase
MKIAVFGNMDIDAEEGIEVKRYSVQHFAPNAKLIGNFDRIYASNTIPELARDDVLDFLGKVRSLLKDEGELIVQVPMAEYACRQIFTNKADLMTYYMLYGNDDHPFRACYTMAQIRTLLARAGFNVHEASEAILKLTTTTGEVVDLPVHSLVVVKTHNLGGK